MNKPYSLEESQILLYEKSVLFLKFINNLMEITNVNEVNMIGAGNSIGSGWTAIDNNVNPLIKKLEPFIKSVNKTNLNFNFADFSKPNDNSNEKIYNLLNNNHSLDDMKELF